VVERHRRKLSVTTVPRDHRVLFVDPDEDAILSTYKAHAQPAKAPAKAPAVRATVPAADRERLERVLQELVACRQMIDAALKEG